MMYRNGYPAKLRTISYGQAVAILFPKPAETTDNPFRMGSVSDQRAPTNTFDLLRLIAAALVLWSHHFALVGRPEPSIALLQCSVGSVSLYAFFAISGYLNVQSLKRGSARQFLIGRALRIYPALAVCVALMVALASAVMMTLAVLSALLIEWPALR